MQFMMMVKMREDLPEAPPELYAAMETYIGEALRSGRVVSFGGLQRSAEGAEVRGGDGKVVVSHGPFAETTELVGGWTIWTADSLDEAVAEGEKFIQLHVDTWPEFRGACEIRPVVAPPA